MASEAADYDETHDGRPGTPQGTDGPDGSDASGTAPTGQAPTRPDGPDGPDGPAGDDAPATAPAPGDAIAAADAARPQSGETVRIDSWIWSVRLVKTRSMGAAACKGGHVRVNGERVKPAHSVRVGDEVRLRHEGRERIVVVKRLIRKRVGPPVAVQCYVDNSPPPPPREAVAPAGVRDRGTGRPTKRDRRELERLRALRGLGGRPTGGRPEGH
ncbi:RNA-binding S4 domain-containing protein [Streptomyces sp. GESEQ-35]|uniref:RNA-binding S4 domain-containing protein n=1 Tax=Streptomyces sp. GESEQ-35 TaxID=2812657 RepID=UPI001FF4647D|nr:RNA-binding S4 domain-containing protein [Streptomyces sp. GESEQ-35]